MRKPVSVPIAKQEESWLNMRCKRDGGSFGRDSTIYNNRVEYSVHKVYLLYTVNSNIKSVIISRSIEQANAVLLVIERSFV